MIYLSTMKKKKLDERQILTLVSLFVTIFVYVGAVAIFFYANGWRIDPFSKSVFKTGVLTVQSEPFLANLYINNNIKGRTPKSVSLPIGIYDISVSKTGYITWRKDVEIKEEKSTPVYPWLIRESATKQNIFLLQDSKYINSWVDESSSYIYFLTYNTIPNIILPDSNTYIYSLYRFELNTSFWNMSTNPSIILTLEYTDIQPQIELLLSPNGTLSILTIKEDDTTKYYLLDSASKNNTLDTLNELNIEMFSTYTTTWSKDSHYLLFESENDLISLDISKNTRYLLLKKEPKQEYIWTTDEQGFFYYLLENQEQLYENVYHYSLIQEHMDGSNKKVLLKDMFFQQQREYITKYQQDTGSGKYAPFKNSPESTKSVGRIESIDVNQEAKGIYIDTQTSSYWYNITTNKYHLISPSPSKLISFSPNSYKLLFKTTPGFSIFTFLKDPGDHTVSIGAKEVINIEKEVETLNWVSNSLYLWYLNNNSMYIIDVDGDNKIEVLTDMEDIKYISLNTSRDRISSFTVRGIDENSDEIAIDSLLIR